MIAVIGGRIIPFSPATGWPRHRPRPSRHDAELRQNLCWSSSVQCGCAWVVLSDARSRVLLMGRRLPSARSSTLAAHHNGKRSFGLGVCTRLCRSSLQGELVMETAGPGDLSTAAAASCDGGGCRRDDAAGHDARPRGHTDASLTADRPPL